MKYEENVLELLEVRNHNVASEVMGVVPEDLRDNSLLCLNTGRVQVFHCLQK